MNKPEVTVARKNSWTHHKELISKVNPEFRFAVLKIVTVYRYSTITANSAKCVEKMLSVMTLG